MYNPFAAPAMPYPQPAYPQYQQTQQVVRVNGENGARAYNLGPNGSALLLDESGTLVWLVTTDGAGYKTVGAYDITPHQQQLPAEYGDLETRIKRLEEFMNGYTADTAAAKRKPNERDRED